MGEREGGLGDDGDAISDGVLAVFVWGGGEVRSKLGMKTRVLSLVEGGGSFGLLEISKQIFFSLK